jgi:N-acetyl sugar amidotransferase
MKKCSKCVMPDTAETLTFDKNGVCSVCNQIEQKKNIDWDKRAIDLDSLIKKYKDKKNKYDCIVPFSGGKDSTFALWYLVTQKKINPLVVRFDHNFLRSTILENTSKVLSKLKVDFIDFKPNFNVIRKTMLESLKRRGDFCWHCHVGITALPINTALEKKIELIFYGEPSSEYSSFYDYTKPEELNEEKFNRFINLGINAEDMFEMIKSSSPNEEFSIEDLKPYFFPSSYDLKKNKIFASYLGNYIPWDVKKQVEIIKKELDWKGDRVEGIPPEYDYEKIECMMQGSRDYIKFLKRGFGRTTHLASIDIRNDRLKRDNAEELVNLYDGKRPQSLDLLLKILKINEKEFYEILKKQVVYPNEMISYEEFQSKKSNFSPKDIQGWFEKFK